jgi:hypothetical protein
MGRPSNTPGPASIRASPPVHEQETAMPQFLIEREVPGASKMSDAQLREASLASLEALQKLGPEIRWVHSWVTDDKIYCIYYAPDEALLREHGRMIGAPVDRVSAVRRILEPVNFES